MGLCNVDAERDHHRAGQHTHGPTSPGATAMTTPTPAVYIGLDVGKTDHHAVALTATA